MGGMIATAIFEERHRQLLISSVNDIEQEITVHWHTIRDHHPYLKIFANYPEFMRFYHTQAKDRGYKDIFSPIANHYKICNDHLSAKLLIVMAKPDLKWYVRSNRLILLHEDVDKWNCIIEIFLKNVTDKLPYAENYRQMLRLIRSAIKRKEKEFKEWALLGMLEYDDNEPYHEEQKSAIRRDLRCEIQQDGTYLQYIENCSGLNQRYKEIIQWICIDGKSHREYATKYKITKNATTVTFFRAIKRAEELLKRKFPELATLKTNR